MSATSGQVRGSDVEFGDEIGPLLKHPTSEHVQAFLSVWSTRPTSSPEGSQMIGRFTSAEEAGKEGLAGPIIPGNMSQAFLAQLLTDWMGPEGRLVSLDVNFRRPAHHGQELRCVGLVTDKREEDGRSIVKLDVYVENPEGDRPVQGVAEVSLPNG